MEESENKSLPKFGSFNELTSFFDENDMGDFVESLPEAEFEVELTHRKHFVAVDEDIAERLSEISKSSHVPSGAIVNSWLREKISDYSQKG